MYVSFMGHELLLGGDAAQVLSIVFMAAVIDGRIFLMNQFNSMEYHSSLVSRFASFSLPFPS